MTDWQYLARGNANYVFKYTGQNPEYINKVLRIPKRPTLKNTVLMDLLADYALPHHSALQLESLQELKVPDGSELIDIALLDLSNAVLLENLLGNHILVELKPKWGFLDSVACRTCLASTSTLI
jgi:hypothetical protein